MKTVEETRRELFEGCMFSELFKEGYGVDAAHCVMGRGSSGNYSSTRIAGAWQGFNAALDAVEIELPDRPGDYCEQGWAACEMLDDCRAAIEQTGLGIKTA